MIRSLSLILLMVSATQGQAPLADPPYRLMRGDVIEVKFFFNAELNDTMQIRPDGRISLQLIGEMEVAGRTVAEATSLINQAYAKELPSPRVSIQLRGFANQKVFVSGEVGRPGSLSLVGELTLGGALAEAGGVKTSGDRKRVVLIRKGPDGAPLMQTITIADRGQPAPGLLRTLEPYDVVLVPETKISRVDRWVDQYLRQLSPANLAVGFQYLYSKPGVQVAPF